jgi:PAS domain S-box-containing protein
VRITFDGIGYKTENFQKSEASQSVQIQAKGKEDGAIEVYYVGEKAQAGQNAFVEKEHDLLVAVAQHLGRIAERKEATERLGLFRSLIDGSNDAIFVIEPKWGRLLDVNNQACDGLAYTREELLGMTVKDIDESMHDDSAWQQQAEELRLKGDIVKENVHRRSDGTTFAVEMSLRLVEQEKADYIIAIARDITERKQAEDRQAKLLAQLEHANQELKDFAHVVSHDLKAPLRGIKTLADWFTKDYAEKLGEDGKEQVNLLSARVQLMHNLVDGILQYSTAGRVEREKDLVDLNKLVAGVIDVLAPPENFTITVEDELPHIEFERTSITQVFQNLLSNAVKYTDKAKGQITIGCVEEADCWKFSVTDNGIGIEERHFEKIFKLFETLSPRDEGLNTGIGLSLVKKIVELNGGEVWLESTPGQGTTFFFSLPKSEKEVEGAELEVNTVG